MCVCRVLKARQISGMYETMEEGRAQRAAALPRPHHRPEPLLREDAVEIWKVHLQE